MEIRIRFSELTVTGAANGAAAGGTVTLTCAETNSEEPDAATYIWSKGGNVIGGETAKTYEIDPVTQADAGAYTCGATFATSTIEVSVAFTLKVYGRERSFQKLLFKTFSIFFNLCQFKAIGGGTLDFWVKIQFLFH